MSALDWVINLIGTVLAWMGGLVCVCLVGVLVLTAALVLVDRWMDGEGK